MTARSSSSNSSRCSGLCSISAASARSRSSQVVGGRESSEHREGDVADGYAPRETRDLTAASSDLLNGDVLGPDEAEAERAVRRREREPPVEGSLLVVVSVQDGVLLERRPQGVGVALIAAEPCTQHGLELGQQPSDVVVAESAGVLPVLDRDREIARFQLGAIDLDAELFGRVAVIGPQIQPERMNVEAVRRSIDDRLVVEEELQRRSCR